MRCAKCHGALEDRRIGRVSVNQCPECRGIWFDWRELDAVLKTGTVRLLDDDETGAQYRRPAQESAADGHPGTCPRCATPLARFDSLAVEGLHFDQCEGCRGVWLDRGEITR